MLILFIFGERAVELGQSPEIAIGHGAMAGALIALAGVAVLVIMRPLTFALDPVQSTAPVE